MPPKKQGNGGSKPNGRKKVGDSVKKPGTSKRKTAAAAAATGGAVSTGAGGAVAGTGAPAGTDAVAVAAAAPKGGRETRSQKKARVEEEAKAKEQGPEIGDEEERQGEEEERLQEEETERLRQEKKARIAEQQKATLPALQDLTKADAQVEAAAAAMPKARLKLNVTRGPPRVQLNVTKRSQDAEALRLAILKDREDRIARGENVSPLPSSPSGSSSSSSSSENDSSGDGDDNNAGPPPRDSRFLCGVEGCSSGAYSFVELKRHYKTVHRGRGMPKSENDVRKANFIDWLNDRIGGYPATKQAKLQYAPWVEPPKETIDKENIRPDDVISDAPSGGRKRRHGQTEADADEGEAQASRVKRRRAQRYPDYGWLDEEVQFEKRVRRLRSTGKTPLQPAQGQNLVDQAHLDEMQRIRDEQEDQIRGLRKTLRNNILQLEAARRAGDYARHKLNDVKGRLRATEKIASDNNVSFPEADDADEYQKLLLVQAFGEKEAQWQAETQRWDWNLLQRRAYHIYRRQAQSNDEWDAEESRLGDWTEPTDMRLDGDEPQARNENGASRDLVFDQEEIFPRPAYVVEQNNPDDIVSATGQGQQTEVGRRLTYPQRRFLREWATLDSILPRATVPGLPPPSSQQASQSPADRSAQEDQPQDADQESQEQGQQSIVPVAAEGAPDPVAQPAANAPATDAVAQEPPQGWFRLPAIRSQTGQWTCDVM